MVNQNKPSILEQSEAALPKSERKRCRDALPELIQESAIYEERRKELTEQINMVGLEFDNGHILEEYGLERLNDLSNEQNENYRLEVKLYYKFFLNIFGFERSEEILRDLYQNVGIARNKDLKNKGINIPKEVIKDFNKMINFYIDEIFTGN